MGATVRIRDVWIRFYKSFNFDYELKAHPNSSPNLWQVVDGIWYPHVRVPLEDDITAVVGANESGKSHLLDAINIVLTGEGLRQRDFCRYSPLFSVESGARRFPEVGASFTLTEDDKDTLAALAIPLTTSGELLVFRPEPDSIEALDSAESRVILDSAQIKGLEAILPTAYHLKTQVDLPDSVSLAHLAGADGLTVARRERASLFELLAPLTTTDAVTNQAPSIVGLLAQKRADEAERQRLGALLLKKVAQIDVTAFRDLREAIAEEREGLVNALIQQMNLSIARHLNISKWWSQDADFELRVSPREYELVFTIRDRTGTDYSFSERSRGLTYFLSYYVQLRAHEKPLDRSEVLLMDEPDAYLSALGQQDLLRVLEDHAHPEDTERRDQVVYVTHSPFLINRNAGHRVRVVDKGGRDEGTRLVKDATQNHYEPLRTSLGSYIAETAFIGGDNLFVEGIADQVLLSGMNARLRRRGAPPSQTLDLNEVTIVPGGSNVPYMLYLARGRDQYKPACAALLDSDKAGRTAREQIRRGGSRGRPTLPDDLILLVGEWAAEAKVVVEAGVVVDEPEDLVPLQLATEAAHRYASHVLNLADGDAQVLTEASIRAQINASNSSLWDAIARAFEATFDTNIGKAGFAKELLACVEGHSDDDDWQASISALDGNISLLLARLSELLRLARERENDNRRNQRVSRIIDEFTQDHPSGCIRDRASMLLRRIDSAAEDTPDGDLIRAGTARLRRRFALDADPLDRVAEYDDFLAGLKELPTLVRLENQGRLSMSDLQVSETSATPA